MHSGGFSHLEWSDRVIFIDRLIGTIESKGLCVVGLYRVAGNAAKIKQLVKDMTTAASAPSAAASASSSGQGSELRRIRSFID